MSYYFQDRNSTKGFTLIELTVVIVLVGLLSILVVNNFSSIFLWKVEGEIRKFASTWEFLYTEAQARGENYRLLIDLNEGSYAVRREVSIEIGEAKQVDYLANFRNKMKRYQERKKKEEDEAMLSLNEEFEAEDKRQSGALDQLFYEIYFSDPKAPKRLAVPLEFPSLAEATYFAEGVKVRDVVVGPELIEQGLVALHLGPGGASDFAVIHLQVGEEPLTVAMNPASGKVSVLSGYLNLDWKVEFKRDEN